jgi:hypothetical protein
MSPEFKVIDSNGDYPLSNVIPPLAEFLAMTWLAIYFALMIRNGGVNG